MPESELFQFEDPGAQFDYNSNSSFWCYPNDIENGAFSGEGSQSASSMDQNPFADEDQMFSWSNPATSSNPLFFPYDSTPTSSDSSTGSGVLGVDSSQDTCPGINQDVSLCVGSETEDVDTDMEDDSSSEMEPSADLSQEDPSTFDPHTACRGSTESPSVRSSFVQVSLP